MSVSCANEAPDKSQPESRFGEAERDLIALGIAAAAIIMFLGTGGSVVPQVVQSLTGTGGAPSPVLINALLLNIALIIFGWRRYRQLREEIEERRRAELLARTLAETDPLTGTLNRRSMDEQTTRILEASAMTGDVVAMLMIDLDNFKMVNDLNGHAAGDQILLQFARRIEKIIPKDAIFARIGGDEFALAFSAGNDVRASVDRLAVAIGETVSEPLEINGMSIGTTASTGIALSDMKSASKGEVTDAATLMHMADIAMYHAKKHGRNCHSWFEEPMESELGFRKSIENGIRVGIVRGEFIPYYEKQIDLDTGKLTGFEVLARWNSPTMGIVNPDVFIPVAEEIGAIADLSESVIAQALEDARHWDPSLTVAVNISPIQLRDPWFSQKLLKLLVNANFPPERFEIEITESCLHENIGVVRSLIVSLQNQGIRVTLDDFGTGYSSIGQLRSLPFDRLKIDRSFISGLLDDQDAVSIVDGIALLGKGLGLPVTAEGIEDSDILDRLKQYENIKGQGYLYGRPQPASVVHEALAQMSLLKESEAPVAIPTPDRNMDAGEQLKGPSQGPIARTG